MAWRQLDSSSTVFNVLLTLSIAFYTGHKQKMAKMENLYKGCSVPVNFFWQRGHAIFQGGRTKYDL